MKAIASICLRASADRGLRLSLILSFRPFSISHISKRPFQSLNPLIFLPDDASELLYKLVTIGTAFLEIGLGSLPIIIVMRLPLPHFVLCFGLVQLFALEGTDVVKQARLQA